MAADIFYKMLVNMQHNKADNEAYYCTTADVSCKECSQLIPEESLVVAIKAKLQPAGTTSTRNFYHLKCAKKMADRPREMVTIGLRTEDEYNVQAAFGFGKQVNAAVRPADEESSSSSEDEGPEVKGFLVEYAPSSRSQCNGLCSGWGKNINMGEIRIGVLDGYFSHIRKGLYRYYHWECFAIKRDILEFNACGSKLPGYHLLSAQDRMKVKLNLPKLQYGSEDDSSDEGHDKDTDAHDDPINADDSDDEPVSKKIKKM